MNIDKLVNLFFEVGTLRKIARSHRQTLLTDDLSDNIASHSYRVTIIAHFLSQLENANTEKVITMALFHDIAESRSGDQNWVNKRYVKVFEDEILNDQLSWLNKDNNLLEIVKEYNERKTLEAKVAKDADLLDQILLLREYENNGNQEAVDWLKGKGQLKLLTTKSAKKLAEKIYETSVHDWWKDIWTEKRR
ncbi:MAG: HD domain-containing protein [Ignavibacteriae bacterium]|nr:HD domain-containing protein [Ignavibacteriota bacterium]